MKGNTPPATPAIIAAIAANIPKNRPHALSSLNGLFLTVQSRSTNFCIAA